MKNNFLIPKRIEEKRLSNCNIYFATLSQKNKLWSEINVYFCHKSHYSRSMHFWPHFILLIYLHRRNQAVHMVSSVTVVTKQKLVVILGCSTQCASLALDALPGVLLHTHQHVGGELQAGWMS